MAMPNTPAQARFKKLKQIYERAKNEQLDPQQKLNVCKENFLPAHETTKQVSNTGELCKAIMPLSDAAKSSLKNYAW